VSLRILTCAVIALLGLWVARILRQREELRCALVEARRSLVDAARERDELRREVAAARTCLLASEGESLEVVAQGVMDFSQKLRRKVSGLEERLARSPLEDTNAEEARRSLLVVERERDELRHEVAAARRVLGAFEGMSLVETAREVVESRERLRRKGPTEERRQAHGLLGYSASKAASRMRADVAEAVLQVIESRPLVLDAYSDLDTWRGCVSAAGVAGLDGQEERDLLSETLERFAAVGVLEDAHDPYHWRIAGPSVGEVQHALLGEGVRMTDEQVRRWSTAHRRDVMVSAAALDALLRVVKAQPLHCQAWAPFGVWLSEAEAHGLPAPAPGAGSLMSSLERVVIALDALVVSGVLERRAGAQAFYRIVAAPERAGGEVAAAPTVRERQPDGAEPRDDAAAELPREEAP